VSHAPSPEPDPHGWTDLAAHRPGRDSRLRADRLRRQWRSLGWLQRRRTSRAEERRWREAGDAKRQVARSFERLGPDWRVLHALPGGPDAEVLDHLLVGPGGVFAVNSSHHASRAVCLGGDTLIVDGKRVHHVAHSRRQAARASRLLSAAVGFPVPVTGLVVVVGDSRFDTRQPRDDGSVHVTTPRGAVRLLRRHATEWTPYGVERIYELARRSSTWEDGAVGEPTAAAAPPAADGEAPDARAAS
jgi:hypothetical protein